MYRTHTCGQLNAINIEKTAQLSGWVHARRDHGGIIFIDLRDRYGITQIVFNPDCKDFETASTLRREDVITIDGNVIKRKQGMENSKISTGEIEVDVKKLVIVNRAMTPPMEIDDKKVANEELRLKYRYIDLRRPIMQKNLIFRHNVILAARNYFNAHDFIEVETPIMVKPTPEGARDYVVPSRVNPGKFFALPQSPQLYKQILMVAGMDRYYQVARCMRDEDLREDRQPEHTQFDIEMSFVTSDDIRAFVEGLVKHIFKEVKGIELKKFPLFSYKTAMERFGSDKPDIRFGLELVDITEIAKRTEFGVFKNAEVIKCLAPEKELTRKEIEDYTEFTKIYGAKGLAWAKVVGGKLESSVSKFISEDLQKEIITKANAKDGSTILFIADKKKKTETILGQLRKRLRDDLGIVKGREEEFAFCWINDFPLFAYNEEEQKWEPEHHMFSTPKQEFVDDFETRPAEVLGDLWDLALNGVELSSGSIRISNPQLQERIMNFVGIDKEAAHRKFGFLLDAYNYGGPIHGGMGVGVDRLCAMMLGFTDIREVIAFPKNKNAQCPMDGSPADLEPHQLKELHIKLNLPEKKVEPQQ
ncbi:MAG: aspartate--tRNA ligase [Candidatus Woesearchaeota archaeon]|jgi:aspartyl-tRNA synthetase